jgi:hypothetical protein
MEMFADGLREVPLQGTARNWQIVLVSWFKRKSGGRFDRGADALDDRVE